MYPQILPLHPLTIEDILHQETREKIESFPALGYYFVIFRALDESYFRYTSPEAPAQPGQTGGVHTRDEADDRRAREHGQQLPGTSSGRRGRVDIVEGVGGKEGVEGVGVGAVNLYLVVYGDGILSVSQITRDASIPTAKYVTCVSSTLKTFRSIRSGCRANYRRMASRDCLLVRDKMRTLR